MSEVTRAAVLLVALLLAGPAQAESLDVLYFEYPPYYHQLPDGSAGGFLVDLGRKVFQRAGVTPRFLFVPSKRIIKDIQDGRPAASLGWFRTPERESFARFSRPFYVNKPYGILYLKSQARRFHDFTTLRAVMESGAFSMGRVGGLSDGVYVDGILAEFPERVVEVSSDTVRLLHMLQARRFDFVLVPPEEVAVALELAQVPPDDFEIKPMSDIPQGNTRYIMYSKAVDEALVRRIDAALAQEVAP